MIRYFVLLAGALLASSCAQPGPAQARDGGAACAKFAARLASAKGGETVTLAGECERIVIARRFERPVTLDMRKARVKGLKITGANVTISGGVFMAPAGLDGFAYDGYAIDIRDARDVRVTGATITQAKKGMVINRSRNIVIERNHFWRLREDGIIAATSENVAIERNRFTESQPNPTRCTLPDGTVVVGAPRRDCKGSFDDGNHADAIQVYDGMTDLRIRWNHIEGNTQGIGQMGGRTSAPMRRVTVAENYVAGSQAHQISLYRCEDCTIARNTVRRGGTMKAIIREGTATRCGNDVADQKPDGACDRPPSKP